ncbi:hypothetical protein OBBRIDRAFT_887625 [Obba rivulosa]|uniref:Uncharacterized protein n=1 Tax=Obba rivulosa TaxID=1052685 RepID=A0A8E2AYQ4_9APHY|nr:hypothetical protein OBBRIDRAFT_887625 [Obba rivulosa]
MASAATSSTGLAVRRRLSHALTHRSAPHRQFSALLVPQHVPARVHLSSCLPRCFSERKSSTSAVQPIPDHPERDSHHAEALDLFEQEEEEFEDDYLMHQKGEGTERYLVWTQSGKHYSLRWRAKLGSGGTSRGVLLLRSELAQVAADFISLVDNSPYTVPRESDADKLQDLVTQLPEGHRLRTLVAHRAMQFFAVSLAHQGYPRHALLAMCLACFGTALDQRHWWLKLATVFGQHRYWDWVPTVLELQWRFDGRSTAHELNVLLESDVEKGLYADRKDILELFQRMGGSPNARTRGLLAKISTLAPHCSPSDPSSGVVRVLDIVAPDRHKPTAAKPMSPAVQEACMPHQVVAPSVLFPQILGELPTPPRIAHAPELVHTLHKDPDGRKLLRIFFKPKRTIRLAVRMIQAGYPLHAVHAVNIAWRLKPDRDREAFDRVGRVFVEHQQWQMVLLLFDLELEASGGQKTAAALNRVLRAWFELGIRKEPEEITEMFKNAGVQPGKSAESLIRKVTSLRRTGSEPASISLETSRADINSKSASLENPPAASENSSQTAQQ